MKKIILLALIAMAPFSFAVECRPRADDAKLTLSSVMYNWGRATRIVGTTAFDGRNNPSSIDSERWQSTKIAVEIARECARQVIMARDNPDLLPQKAKSLAGPEREAFIAKFKEKAREFSALLDELYNSVCEYSLASPSQEVFIELRDKVDALEEGATDAHRSL